MQQNIKLLITLIFMGFAIQGKSVNPDTLSFPQRIMDLPKVVEHDGDRAGAWGLPSLVALHYGLTVDETTDERLDETFSRRVALQYLADLYSEFGDWELCYYAYLYSPAYVRNLQMRNLSIPQPKPEVKKPAPPKPEEKPAKAKEKPQTPQYTTYTVKSGDTLSKIAQKYHVKVNDIKKWNNLKSDLIRENQKLKIYQ